VRRASLSGAWSGAYRYPGDAAPETVFSALIEEIDGAFTGTTQEPDTRRRGVIVTADIDGVRRGGAVSFTKFMDGSGGMRHVVLYEGQADEALTSVTGTWTIPQNWSGTFFMTRDDDGASETVERAEALDV